MIDNVANRYAHALLDIAIEEKLVDEYRQVIKEINKCFQENKDYLHVLSSSFLSGEEKHQMIEKAFASLNFPHVLSFMNIIIDNHRVNELLQIFDSFNTLCNDYKGIKEGIVYSTIKLSDKEVKEIETAISKVQNCEIELRNEIDSRLLGGVKVVVHDSVYDGSLLGKLESMKNKLL